MTIRIRRILNEPLVQFIFLGALIFSVNGWWGESEVSHAPKIEVSASQVDRLGRLFERKWRRPPTDAEMRSLIDQHVREEIMYREALSMGLDQDDAIVRRRLSQKLSFLSEDLTPVPSPDEATLGRFFEQNRDAYHKPGRMSFTHVYFSPDRRGDHADGDAREALAVLQSENSAAEASMLGDPFMLMHTYARRSEQEIADFFGHDFAKTVMELPVGAWQGPVPSGYGLHLVRISSRTASRNPSLDEVRTQVSEDFKLALRQKANDAFYGRLRDRYQVIIHSAAGTPGAKEG